MDLFYGGTEVPSHRKMLAESGVETVSLSYMGLRRRTKFSRPWMLADKFPADQRIFVDSGAYTINSADEDKFSVGELRDIASHYMGWVHANIDRIEMVSEFDATVLGREWLEGVREDFWNDLPDKKFMPIWHPETGTDELDRLAREYDRVGVPQTAMGGRNLTPLLNSLVQKYGTMLHGVAMTKPDAMGEVRWDSVASTSWISPSQFGDTIVWVNNELKRYPKKYKDQARKRHRTLFTDAGFDAAKIEDDDPQEVLRLSIWSWQQQVDAINRHAKVVTTTDNLANDENPEKPSTAVAKQSAETRNVLPTERPERKMLPVLNIYTETEAYTDEEGQRKEREIPLIASRSQSMRLCDGCFLAQKCPAFQSGSNCAYDIPIRVESKSQMQHLQNALIEMQAQRVMFMRMAEDMEGGYADPNLSNEFDRLQRLIKSRHEMEQDGFSIKVEARGSGGDGGVISRLFGRDAGEQARALPEPVSAERAVEIIDADLIDE